MTPANPNTKRSVLVTGATTGIGRMIANGFAAEGHLVFICARTKRNCEQAAQEIGRANSGNCVGVACDISTREGIETLERAISSQTDTLHAIVNNAGSVSVAPLDALSEADWDRVVDINLKAVFFVTQKLVPLLRKAASPDWPASIINIGSIGGLGIGARPNYAYMASKAGVHHLTRALGKWLGPEHINVNAIACGVFPSEITRRELTEGELKAMSRQVPCGRLGEAKDIVGLTQFLASRAASYIAGAVIPLDGGMSVSFG
jgi:NAD(P)-dependent dehydrogenase (short-subunit alcohol dehydrogenase family)